MKNKKSYLKLGYFVLGTLALCVLGYNLRLYAGSCYISKAGVPASQLGCSEGTISPVGPPCTSIWNPYTTGTQLQCRQTVLEQSIASETISNANSGQKGQQSSPRACYKYRVCQASNPYPNGGLPIADNLVFDCTLLYTAEGSATRQHWEAIGDKCPDEEK